jgi:hypothetical protein
MPHVLHRILRYLHDEQDNVALSANGLPVQYLILDLTREFQLHNPCLLPNKHLHFQIVIYYYFVCFQAAGFSLN